MKDLAEEKKYFSSSPDEGDLIRYTQTAVEKQYERSRILKDPGYEINDIKNKPKIRIKDLREDKEKEMAVKIQRGQKIDMNELGKATKDTATIQQDAERQYGYSRA